MRLPSKEELQPLLWTAGILFVSAWAGTMFTTTSAAGMFSFAAAIFSYLVLPGYFIMLNFAADALERIILGMVVSSAMVPMYLYAINAAGFKISLVNIITGIILIILLAAWYRKKDSLHHEK